MPPMATARTATPNQSSAAGELPSPVFGSAAGAGAGDVVPGPGIGVGVGVGVGAPIAPSTVGSTVTSVLDTIGVVTGNSGVGVSLFDEGGDVGWMGVGGTGVGGTSVGGTGVGGTGVGGSAVCVSASGADGSAATADTRITPNS